TIRTERVPLEPDKIIFWVDATLNGTPGRKMVVEPGISYVRISAPLAAEVGLRPAADAPTVEVALADGRTGRARRATPRAVQVGPFTAADVECLVWPEDHGDVPALLGGSFLGRFTSRVDPEAGQLTLSQVSQLAAPPTAKPVNPASPR